MRAFQLTGVLMLVTAFADDENTVSPAPPAEVETSQLKGTVPYEDVKAALNLALSPGA